MKKGFTLIELLIVVSIMGVLTVGVMEMTLGAGRHEERTRSVIEIEETGVQVRAAWRADLLAAREVRIESAIGGQSGAREVPVAPSAGGQAMSIQRMSIRRAMPDGKEITIVYRLADGGAIERVVAGRPESLARGVIALTFEPAGKGWRMNWTLGTSDGINRQTWPQTAFATPLAPEVKP